MLFAKSLDAPVWSLLGKKVRTRSHMWAGGLSTCRPKTGSANAKRPPPHGYTTFKTKARPWFDLEDQVQPDCPKPCPITFKLDLDFNDFGLDPAVARPLCKRLERFSKVAIWESPIAQEDVEGNRTLRRHLSVPIAHHIDRPAFETQIRRDICDGFVMEGGITHALGRGRTCAEFNKPFWLQWVGSNLAATFCLHIQAALSHARWPAIHCNHMYADQFIDEPWVVSNGLSAIPDKPGSERQSTGTLSKNTASKRRTSRTLIPDYCCGWTGRPGPRAGLLMPSSCGTHSAAATFPRLSLE